MVRVGYVLTILAILTSCSDRSFTPTIPEALKYGDPHPVFVVTSREKEENGNYGFQRSDDLDLLELTVSIPRDREPGTLNFGYANPDPKVDFAIAGRKEFLSQDAFRARLNDSMRRFSGDRREITVFVHGYNATQSETAYRAAQMAKDINLPGAVVIYSWPSRGKPLGYAYDSDSLLFARDGLEHLLRLAKSTGAKRIILVAHSLGGALSMEALRQIEIEDPGWAARNLGGVLLISPDLDVEVFRQQLGRFSRVPSPFVVLVSDKDKALNWSARLRGTKSRKRLGSVTNVNDVADLPISILDLTAFSKEAESSHFVAATSPSFIAMLGDARLVDSTFSPENITVETLFTGRPGTGNSVAIVLSPSNAGAR